MGFEPKQILFEAPDPSVGICMTVDMSTTPLSFNTLIYKMRIISIHTAILYKEPNITDFREFMSYILEL